MAKFAPETWRWCPWEYMHAGIHDIVQYGRDDPCQFHATWTLRQARHQAMLEALLTPIADEIKMAIALKEAKQPSNIASAGSGSGSGEQLKMQKTNSSSADDGSSFSPAGTSPSDAALLRESASSPSASASTSQQVVFAPNASPAGVLRMASGSPNTAAGDMSSTSRYSNLMSSKGTLFASSGRLLSRSRMQLSQQLQLSPESPTGADGMNMKMLWVVFHLLLFSRLFFILYNMYFCLFVFKN